MPRVGNRGETHVWFNGEFWSAYSERAADIRKFERLFGKPSRLGVARTVAHWDKIPRDALRINRKRSVRPQVAKTLVAKIKPR